MLATNFQNNVRANAIKSICLFAGGPTLLLWPFAGFSYDSYYAQGNILYARGTTPLAALLRDQELNRVWSGGIDAKAA